MGILGRREHEFYGQKNVQANIRNSKAWTFTAHLAVWLKAKKGEKTSKNTKDGAAILTW